MCLDVCVYAFPGTARAADGCALWFQRVRGGGVCVCVCAMRPSGVRTASRCRRPSTHATRSSTRPWARDATGSRREGPPGLVFRPPTLRRRSVALRCATPVSCTADRPALAPSPASMSRWYAWRLCHRCDLVEDMDRRRRAAQRGKLLRGHRSQRNMPPSHLVTKAQAHTDRGWCHLEPCSRKSAAHTGIHSSVFLLLSRLCACPLICE